MAEQKKWNKQEFIDHNAPCMYLYIDEEKEIVEETYPYVDCDFKCSTCSWNPKEKERRLKTGKWKQIKSRKMACPPYKKIVFNNDVKRLVFKKKKERGNGLHQ